MSLQCSCGGDLKVNENMCYTTWPCQHDTVCLKCGAKDTVFGGGSEPGGCGPFFLDWDTAVTLQREARAKALHG